MGFAIVSVSCDSVWLNLTGMRLPLEGSGVVLANFIWEFPKIRGTLLWGPYD